MDIKMQLGKWISCALIAVLPATASALSLEEARDLARGKDPGALEQAFSDHQAQFNTAEIAPGEFRTPYGAFYTADPLVIETVEEWQAAFPHSPQAMAARASIHVHLGIVLRGKDFINRTPRGALERMASEFGAALDLAEAALKLEPRQLQAARDLSTAGTYLGNRAALRRGWKIRAEIGDRKDLFYEELHNKLPQWGGSVEQMGMHCLEAAAAYDGGSEAECLAVATLKLGRVSRAERLSAIKTLENLDDRDWIDLRAQNLARSGKRIEAMMLYDRHDHWIGYQNGVPFENWQDPRRLRRLSERWLELNPYHPIHLSRVGWARQLEGDRTGALEAAERILQYGEFNPDTRYWRLEILLRGQPGEVDVLADAEDAITDTDWHPRVTFLVVSRFYDEEFAAVLKVGAGGGPQPDLECRKYWIELQHVASCKTYDHNHHACSSVAEITERIERAISRGQCKATTAQNTRLIEFIGLDARH